MWGEKIKGAPAGPAPSQPVALCAQPVPPPAVCWTVLDQLTADARSEQTEEGRRLVAIWAGLQAVRVGADYICPFNATEPDLVSGFLRGVELGMKPRWQGSVTDGGPIAARVPTGRLWAFSDHPTMAEVMFEERYGRLGGAL